MPITALEASGATVGFGFTDTAATSGTGHDPGAYASLAASNGSFDPSGTVMIDTDALTINGVGGNGIQDGGVAVFAFTSIQIDLGVTIVTQGSRPLALLSTGTIVVDGLLDLRPQETGLGAGTNNFANPGAGGGAGGFGTSSGSPATGAPANSAGKYELAAGGSGGASGGNGGNGSDGNTGGVGFGSPLSLATTLIGGSGGGAGGNFSGGYFPQGGDGGGVIELGASGNVTISGTGKILADGGDGDFNSFAGGGGGGGGGVFVHGFDVVVQGQLSANGGSKDIFADPGNGGGGGGGGRILVAEQAGGVTSVPTVSGVTSANGGTSGSGGTNSQSGSIVTNHTLTGSSTVPTYSYVIDWGAAEYADSMGAVPSGDVTVSGTNITGTVFAALPYDDNGVYSANVTITSSAGGLPVTESYAITINNVDPTANAGGPYLTFDDTTITLNGSATDPAGALDPLSFVWDLDDDGIFGETGAGALRGNESGATPVFNPTGLAAGSYDVHLRVTDGDGGVADVSTSLQVLTQGTLLIDGVLYVVGGNTANDIVLIGQCSGTISVWATFNSSNPATFSAAAVTEIQVRTRGGNDVVLTACDVMHEMTIDGGNGNDFLTGGGGVNLVLGGSGNDALYGASGDDVLLGGSGNDDLLGGGGNDVLVGGLGNDVMWGGDGRDVIIGGLDNDDLDGGNGEDILIGGYTIHDGNPAMLDAVMDEWESSASFNDRVATLTGSGGVLQAGVAVFDDNDHDELDGGAGRDLYFADMSKSGDGVKDAVAIQNSLDALVAVN